MSRSQIPFVVEDPATGDAIAGASAHIINRITSSDATIFNDETSGLTSPNPQLSDADGHIPGWLNEGAYSVTVSGGSLSPYTIGFDILSGRGVSLIADGAVTTTKIAASAVTTGKIADGAVTAAKLASSLPQFEQIGFVSEWAGSSDPNANWMICDGRALSRTTYSALFAVISTTYGVGDGSTTFNIPDARGRTTVGAGTGAGLTNRALGVKVGEEVHPLNLTEMPFHGHSGSTGYEDHNLDHEHAVPGTPGDPGGNTYNGFIRVVDNPSGALHVPALYPGGWNASYATTFGISSGMGAHYHGFATAGAGGNGAHNNMQPSIAFNKVIRVL